MTPFDPGSLFARARAGDAATVIAELGHHVTRMPDDFDAWLTLGLVYAEDDAPDSPDRAEEALSRALALRPSSVLALVARARFLPPHVGRRELERAHALAPDNAGILLELARIERSLGHTQDALRHLRAARLLAGDDEARARVAFSFVPLALALAAVPRLLGAPSAALAVWSHAIGEPPDDAADAKTALPAGFVRGDGVLIEPTFGPHGDPNGAIVALFAFVARARLAPIAANSATAPIASALPLVAFVASALGVAAAAATHLVQRLGAEHAIDDGGARLTFTTRTVPVHGDVHGIRLTRLPP